MKKISKVYPFSKFIEKKYVKSKEKETGHKNIFFEKIGSSNSSREERLKALIEALQKQGWTLKEESNDEN
tara:strand:- start:172 stop:381 length:210 start_codon:yes stop_codon:yes gene_type:complete